MRPPQLWRRSSLLERSLAHLDALILPSRSSAALHSRFAPVVRLEVINHFAPEGSDPPAAAVGSGASEGGGRPYFLYAGRLEPIKNVGSLIAHFRNRRSLDLVIAGDGALGRRLRREAAGLSNIRFTGWLDEQELDSLYHGALAVLMPTAGHEAFALVAVEAMARGTPVIAHRFGALEELIEESGAGITYATSAELGEALDRISADRELREELGRRGREACAERYSLDAHLRRYLSLIGTLARERGDQDLASRTERAVPDLAAAGGSGIGGGG
jgi:glycosyltransferase involved in cell wall biosynthesis